MSGLVGRVMLVATAVLVAPAPPGPRASTGPWVSSSAVVLPTGALESWEREGAGAEAALAALLTQLEAEGWRAERVAPALGCAELRSPRERLRVVVYDAQPGRLRALLWRTAAQSTES